MEKTFVILSVVGFFGLGALIAGCVLFPLLSKEIHHRIEEVSFTGAGIYLGQLLIFMA